MFGGKIETYQLADIVVDTPFIKGKISACVLENYPNEYMYYDVLIGNGGTLNSPRALVPTPEVIMKWEASHNDVQGTDDSEMKENSFISNDLFSANEVETRAQKSNENRARSVLNDKVLNFNVFSAELADLQKADKSLAEYFDLVDKDAKKTKNNIKRFCKPFILCEKRSPKDGTFKAYLQNGNPVINKPLFIDKPIHRIAIGVGILLLGYFLLS